MAGDLIVTKNHWIEFQAENEQVARDRAFEVLGAKWAFLYTKEKFSPEFFPAGPVTPIEFQP